MSASFDPYHKWLGISADEQPASLYRLLGVRSFEADPDVIDTAADQRIRLLKTFQSGQHAALSQKLLNEVSRARQRLLNPTERAAYDTTLREQLQRQAKGAASSGSAVQRAARWPEGRPPASLDEFFQCASASGVLTESEARQATAALRADKRPSDPKGMATELVRAGKLTKYQALGLLQGKLKYLSFGEYLILEKLGQGGMGQVMKAEHRRMKRVVALKLISGESLKNPDAVRRFQREVQASARLIHPNIVTAFDANECEGMHYYVMEYVDGLDLGALGKVHGPLPLAMALDYVLQAARGLAYAHSKGIVHRDIKPANLLVDKDGTVKILDMGLARMERGDEAHELTNTGQVLGTVDYMAPEQAEDTHAADARADIYSLGCTLYRLLAGEVMYAGDSMMRKLLAHRDSPIPALRAKRPEVKPTLEATWQKMVAKLPQHRQQTMAQVVAELEGCLRGEALPASTAPTASDSVNLKLNEFLSGMSARDSGRSSSKAPQTSSAGLAVAIANPSAISQASEATQNFKSGETDPNTLVSIPSLSKLSSASAIRTAGTRTRPLARRKLPAALLIGAAVAVLAVAGGGFALVRSGSRPKQPAASSTAPNAKAKSSKTRPDPGSAGGSSAAAPPAASEPPPPLAQAPFTPTEAKQHQDAWAKNLGQPVEITNSINMKMVLIPPGKFRMGSSPPQLDAAVEQLPNSALAALRSEGPQREVTISEPFWLGAHEVTVREFQLFINATGHRTAAESDGKGAERFNPTTNSIEQRPEWTWKHAELAASPQFPVTCVTLADAQAFCDWLSQKHRRTYFLPTEAQWEYACRAGTATQWYWGDDPAEADRFAWPSARNPVAGKLANAFGLFDMLSSAAEITRAEDGSPVWRGGAANGQGPWLFRSASREPRTAAGYLAGFRVAMTDDLRKRANLSPDRRATQWALDLQGSVQAKDSPVNIDAAEKVPAGDFKIVRLTIAGKPGTINNDDLQLLRGLSELTDLSLGNSAERVTDQNLAIIGGLRTLRVLNLSGARVTDAGLPHLSSLSELTYLNLNNTRITAQGVAALRALTKLNYIELAGTPTSEAVIAIAATFPALTQIRLPDIAYTDTGLAGLASFPSLVQVHLNGQQLSNNPLAAFSQVKTLRILDLSSSAVTDAGLAQLKDCRGLTFLNLRQTKVTAAGVAALQAALPQCKVDWDDPAK